MLGLALSCAIALAGSEPTTASPTGQTPDSIRLEEVGWLGGRMTALALAGDVAYAGSGWTLQVIDLAPPDRPRLAQQLGLPAVPLDAAVGGGLLCLALGEGGLMLLDLADPLRPRPVATLPAQASIRHVAVNDGLAYLLDGVDTGSNYGSARFRVVDLRDPTAPVERGAAVVKGNAVDLALGAGMAFVATADAYDTIVAIDIAEPARPREVGRIGLLYCGTCISAIAWSGQRLYVVGSEYMGLVVVDAADPARMRKLGQARLPAAELGQVPHGDGVVAIGDRAYVFCRPIGLCVYDVGDPGRPRHLASTSSIRGERAVLAGDRIVTGRAGGLQVVSLSDPAAPVVASELALLGRVEGSAAVAGGHLLIGTAEAEVSDALAVLRLADPRLPWQAGRLVRRGDPQRPDSIRDVWVVGELAYVAVEGGYVDGSIKVIDLHDPARPAVLGSVGLRALPGRLARHLDHVYVSEGFEGPVRPGILEIVDVSDPTRPTVSATFDLEGDPAVVDGHLVLAGDGGVRTFDLTDPIAPRRVGGLDLAVTSSLVVERTLYATVGVDRVEELAVVDLSDPTAPKVVGRLGGRFPSAQAKLGHYLLLGWYDSGIHVVDVSDPAAPKSVPGARWPDGEAGFHEVVWDLAVFGDLVYVCSGEGGLHILRLSNLPFTATPTTTPAPTSTATPRASATTTPVVTTTPTRTATTTALPSPAETPSVVATASPATPRAAVYLPINRRGD